MLIWSTVREVLLCPGCRLPFARNEDRLICSRCGVAVARDPDDGFFDLRSHAATQRGLLASETTDSGFTNRTFLQFSKSRFIHTLREMVAQAPPACVLDVGCGGGEYALALEGLCEEYYGLEPSDIPAGRRLRCVPPPDVTLIHHDPERPWPIADQSADLVSFIASYDHLPDRQVALEETWRVLRPGGRLLIGMSSSRFWLKRALVRIGLETIVPRHEDEHACTHSPESLIKEVTSYRSSAVVDGVKADFLHLPNLPKRFSALYASRTLLAVGQAVLGGTIRRIAPQAGSQMIVTFVK